VIREEIGDRAIVAMPYLRVWSRVIRLQVGI
jgi:hypothetical protein